MNAQQAENLRTLIRHMESKCHRLLNMNIVSECGTPACAMGELPSVEAFKAHRFAFAQGSDHMMTMGEERIDIGVVSREFFGLGGESYKPSKAHFRLFGASECNAWGRKTVTPQEWVIEARKVLADYGYTMDDGFAAFKAKILAPLVTA